MRRSGVTVVVFFLCLSVSGCGAILRNATNLGCIMPEEEKDENGGEQNVGSSSEEIAF
ncbi:MAG: hypothetical protein WC582_03205 [Patescibacteria group bacterium]